MVLYNMHVHVYSPVCDLADNWGVQWEVNWHCNGQCWGATTQDSATGERYTAWETRGETVVLQTTAPSLTMLCLPQRAFEQERQTRDREEKLILSAWYNLVSSLCCETESTRLLSHSHLHVHEHWLRVVTVCEWVLGVIRRLGLLLNRLSMVQHGY